VIGLFAAFCALGFAVSLFESSFAGDSIQLKDVLAVLVLVAIGSPLAYFMVRFVLRMTLTMNRYDPDREKES